MRHAVMLALGVLLLAAPGALRAQMGSMPAGSSRDLGQIQQQETPEKRATEAYNKGARSKRKAEGAKDAGERQKLYEKAKADFAKSLAIAESFDALLGLGQVDLALGDAHAALSHCSRAAELKAADSAASACVREATAKASTAGATGAGGGANPPPAATAPPPRP